MKKVLFAAIALVSVSVSANEVTFNNVKAYNEYGYQNQIWNGAFNAYGFCQSKGFADAVEYTSECGEDESTYLDYKGNGRWESRDSGSANRCYPILETVTCRSYE